VTNGRSPSGRRREGDNIRSRLVGVRIGPNCVAAYRPPRSQRRVSGSVTKTTRRQASPPGSARSRPSIRADSGLRRSDSPGHRDRSTTVADHGRGQRHLDDDRTGHCAHHSIQQPMLSHRETRDPRSGDMASAGTRSPTARRSSSIHGRNGRGIGVAGRPSAVECVRLLQRKRNRPAPAPCPGTGCGSNTP
jgi:hypothetical protein